MYVLKWMEGDRVQYVGVFSTLEHGREFMKKVPGYRLATVEEDGFSFEEEIVLYRDLPDLVMVEYGDFRVPISRFSFEGDMMVVWIELDCLDSGNAHRTAIATGATRIDAYSVNNEDVEEYVRKREDKFLACRRWLEQAGYEVSRGCFGSEDGEVIFYRKKSNKKNAVRTEEDWHFLTHMDPPFLDMDLDAELPELLADYNVK
ncbi:MAG: hypothetical protein Q4A41_04080 [Bacillota bacterium]|nr:hypothetical protein [Bacillota bacterium]